MFKDMELSADVMRAYSATSSAPSSKKDPSSFDLSVSVLSQGNWPTYPPFPIALPPALSTALESFKAFYVSKHSGRTLTWAHGLDTCSLRAVFPSKGKGGGKKELLVSLAQAVVLLLFNSTAPAGEGEEEGKLSLEEIAEATKLGAFVVRQRSYFVRRSGLEADVTRYSCSQRRRSSRARSRVSLAARCASSSSTRRAKTSTLATTSPSTGCVANPSLISLEHTWWASTLTGCYTGARRISRTTTCGSRSIRSSRRRR